MPLVNLDDLEREWEEFMFDRPGKRGQWSQDQRWRADNPGKLQQLLDYRAGGARPDFSGSPQGSTERRMVEHIDAYLEAKGTVEPPPPPPPPPSGLRFALGTTSDMAGSATVAQQLGVKLMRSYDRSLSASVDSIVTDCKVIQDRGVQPYLLYGIGSDFETKAPGLIGEHAAAVGPGGSRAHASLPVEWFEIGNEMFYNYKLDVGFGPAYARGFVKCAQAVAAKNPRVRCLFMLDVDAQGGAEYDRLVNGIYGAVPNIHTHVGGWVFHTYGPLTSGGVTKVADLLARVEAKGAPRDIPIFITEDGISTDNGRTVQPHNYGWPLNATYDQAGALIRGKLRDIPSLLWWPRVRVWTHYQARDGQPSGATTDKEAYFGVVQSNGQPKGDLTQSVRDHVVAYG